MSHAHRLHSKTSSASVTARTYLTAGIATLGAGAMALSPVQPLPNQAAPLQQRVVSDMAVSLAAAVDPIQAWVDTFQNAAANLGVLADFYMQKPFPLLQTLAANAQTYAGELANGQGDLIGGQIWNNIQTFFQAPYDPGVTITWPVQCSTGPCPLNTGWIFDATDSGKPINTSTALPTRNPYQTDDQGPMSPEGLLLVGAQLLAGIAEGGMPALAKILDTTEAEAEEFWLSITAQQALIDFVWTPASGQLMGLLGTVTAPLVQLTRSFTAVGAAFQAGEVLDAVYELINIPANMTNAFLNGLDPALDLGPLLKNFLPALGDGQVGLQLGGLLNAQPYNGSLQDPDNPPTEYRVGALWNSLSVINWDFGSGFLMDQNPYGLKNGWGGSVVGLGQYLADELLVTAPEPEEAAAPAAADAAPAPAAAVAEESVPAIVDEDLAEPELVVEVEASDPAPKATAATSDATDDGNTGRAARSGRGSR